MSRIRVRRSAGLSLLLILAVLSAGCSGSEPTTAPSATGSPSVNGSATVGPTGTVVVLMRDGDVDRERGFARGPFVRQLAESCPGCAVTFQDAAGESGTQTTQLGALIGTDVDVVVVDAVEPFTVVTSVQQLRDYGTKVITIGPAVEGADARVAYDDAAVGRVQARSLLAAAGRAPQLLMVNGSPADPAAVAVKAGAHGVLDGSRASIVSEYDDPGDKPRTLRTWLSNVLTFYPPGVLGGAYAATDRIAGEVILAFRKAGAGADLPPVTGADATLAGVRRVVAGTQLMTVYRPLAPGSERTADLISALLAGTDLGVTTNVDGITTVLLDPVPVADEDVADTVVADGYWSAERICTDALARACRQAGLRPS